MNQGFVTIISKAPGFIAYYIVDTGIDKVFLNLMVASISVFQDQAGSEESNRMAAGWVKENIAALLSALEITAGMVMVFNRFPPGAFRCPPREESLLFSLKRTRFRLPLRTPAGVP